MIRFDLKRRWVCFLTGIVLSGFGVAMTTRAGIGTTPISSVPSPICLQPYQIRIAMPS